MLPKIEMPIYEVELISSKKIIQFRPFLVKEQKLFLMNTENSDTESVVKVIRQVLKNCVLTDIDIDSLPIFDLEYLFLNMRARSVSEVASAGMTVASHCAASSFIFPIRIAIGALVNVNEAPSALTFNAVFHAIEFSSRAPKIIPRFPASRLQLIFLISLRRK